MKYVFFILSILYSFIFYIFYTFSLKKDFFLNNLDCTGEKAGLCSGYTIQNVSMYQAIDNGIFFVGGNSENNVIYFQSFFGNLKYEMLIFFIIAIVLFFYFSGSTKERKEIQKKDSIIKKYLTIKNLIIISRKASNYLGFILFYLSLYFIKTGIVSIEIPFSFFILFVNIIILIFYFTSKYSPLSRSFLRINSILFSIYYLLNYFLIILNGENYFTFLDFINSFIVILIFIALLYYEKKINKKKSFDTSILVHLIVYLFGVFLFYLYNFIFPGNLTFWVSVLASIFGVLCFEYLHKQNILKNNKITLRYVGIIFTYVGILFGIIFQSIHLKNFIHLNIIIYTTLLLQAIYNINIHKRYINYISLSIGIFIFIYQSFYTIFYFEIISFKSIHFFIFTLFIGFLLVLFPYIIKIKETINNYILNFFAYIINIFGLIIFLIFNDYNIFYLGIILFIESIFFFLSYNKLMSKK